MITVLYVDDEPVLLDLCSLFLHKSGEFLVTTESNPKKAIDIIRQGNFAAIITDYEMPEMNGIELLKQVRNENPDIPVIIFTGRGREEVVIEALNNGADFYLQKGGDPKAQFTELIHKIKQSVRRRSIELEIRQKNLELQASYQQISAAQEEYRVQFEEINRQAELLAEDEEKFRTVADFTYNWEYWLNPSGTFTYISPSCMRITGYDADDFMQNPDLFGQIIHEEDKLIVPSVFTSLTNQKIDSQYSEYRIITKSGEVKWIGHEILSVFGTDGNYLGIRGSCRDISKRKQYELELLQTKREWEHIFRAIGNPAVILDTNHRILHANDAVLKKTGLTIEELRRKSCFEIFHHPDMKTPPNNCPYTRLRNSGLHEVIEMEMEAFGESYLVSCTPIFDDNGNLNRVIHIATNITKQKEEKEENRVFSELLDNVPGLVLIFDENGTILYANKKALELYGYSRQDFLSLTLQDLSAEENFFIPLLDESANGDFTDFSNEVLHCTKDGKIIPLMVHIQPSIWKERKVFLSVALDISELRKVQDNLFASEQHYRLLAENTSDIIWTMDLIGTFTYISPMIFQLLGYTPKEAMEQNLSDILSPDSYQIVCEKLHHLKQHISDNKFTLPDTVELELIQKDGSTVWVEVAYRLYCDNSDKPLGIIGVSRDISERKKTEEQVSQFGEILDASLNEIYIFNADTLLFIEVNRGARDNLGYSMDELRMLTPLDIKPEITHEEFLKLISPLISETDEIIQFITVHQRKDGTKYPVEVHLQMMYIKNQKVFVAIILDITMRKRTEEALDEANQKLRLLTGLTRHDILNQLTAIEGYLYLLSDEKDMALISQYINLARNVCERIKSTIIFTREYEEFGAVSGAWINIRPIIQSAAEEVPFHGITLDNQIPQSLEVFADPIIRKVFSTLLENSVRHGESITKIRFFTEIRQKSLIIVCEDDGVGINASEKELIFEHGYGKNTGIGLFLAKEILSITRLSIIECGETGLGTRFEITVPADKFRL